MDNSNNGFVAILIGISISFLVFSAKSMADCDEIYLKVGGGYKFEETEMIVDREANRKMEIFSDPYSARIETGVDCGNWSYGISHHSQWRTGFPFNDKGELTKTEFFIDYKFSWGI